MNGWLPASTAFLASAVEAVEALTIVLAVGVTRSWRSALSGCAWGLLTLAAIVLIVGPAIVVWVPFAVFKVGIGILLLLFGLAWLRKAILRYSGRKALHDESAIYAREVQALRGSPVGGGSAADDILAADGGLAMAANPPGGRGWDRFGFAAAYNAVLLEGLEVVLIVLTLGAASATALRWAGLGALGAVVVVAGAGFVLRAPLRRVPENLLKFSVGIMLVSLGTFWCGEGLGIPWWRDEMSLPLIVATYVAVAFSTIGRARRRPTALRSAA